MCDILVATPKATENGVMLFAKNSDRDPNEAQIIEYIPRKEHNEEKIKLTYVEFPQVRETNAIIISRPWWMYGAEMGANEYGLVIGNVAVFTKEPYNEIGITGMDMIRLALERTKTAKEALAFIINIIEKYGQGGSGSYYHKFLYHNSFIIADPKEAWVLETAGRLWVAKKVDKVYSISNGLTIDNDWDLASRELLKHVSEKYGCDKTNFSFAKCLTKKLITHFARAKERRAYTYSKLKEKEGEITLEYMIKILRSHRSKNFVPWKSSMRDICIHYKGTFTPSHTASAQVSLLTRDYQLHWFTGTSNTCVSLFKPFAFDFEWKVKAGHTTDKYSGESYWWKHEKVHRLLQWVYDKYAPKYKKELYDIEKIAVTEFIVRYKKYLKGELSKDKLMDIIDEIVEKEELHRKKWEDELTKIKLKRRGGFTYKQSWKKVNKYAGLNF